MNVSSRHINDCTAVSKHPYEDYRTIVWGYIDKRFEKLRSFVKH